MKNKFLSIVSFTTLLLWPVSLLAEAMHMNHESMRSEKSGDMEGAPTDSMQMKGFYGPYSMTREASGTSWQPDSTPHEGVHIMAGPWMFMFHGYIDPIYNHQGGPRGDNESYTASMFMAMAQRPLGPGTFGLRSMLSLDPTMGKTGYPELLQTGETANGRDPLIDRQHPHDLFMELAATYNLPVGQDSSVFGYLGYPGEPALGPATFMHRFSGIDNPEAPIIHHWLDATHITFGVATLGYVWKNVKLEASQFTGREPNQYRWDFDKARFDSTSARLSFNPTKNWALQTSYGHLKSPEQLEPDVDQNRLTASAGYNVPWNQNNWQTTFAWGRNFNKPGHILDGYVLESAVVLAHTHTVFGRAENVEKDELFTEEDPRFGTIYRVSKLSVGYIYDFLHLKYGQFGIGGLASVYSLPSALDTVYGKTPTSYMVFVRAKLGSTGAHHHAMDEMKM